MDNKPKFDKNLFVTIALQNFLTDYSHSGRVDDAYNKLLNLNKNNTEGRKILENCKALFENPNTHKEVDIEISTIRVATNTTKGRNPTNSEIAKWLIHCFSEEILAVNKRTYDMSQLPAKGFLAPLRLSNGETSKTFSYVPFEQIQQEKQNKDGKVMKQPYISLKDKHGNTVSIKLMGYLIYGTPNGNRSLCKYSITKTIDDVNQVFKKYSNIDIPKLKSNVAYRNVVVHELLSDKNLERSNADDYIGEILSESLLKPGAEKLDGSLYTAQLDSNHALMFDGVKLEAVRAHKQQEAIQTTSQQQKSNEQAKFDDEPEL